ncbi:MAG: enoyl-CoA hydratase-related protein, partial [Pseudomonadota bacterium]
MTDVLLTERDARGVVTLTMNRPDRHNAMNAELIAALAEAAAAIEADASVRVVVLAGAGRSFS